MIEQIFLSPQVKRSVIISDKLVYCKTPKISPWVYAFQRPFWGSLFLGMRGKGVFSGVLILGVKNNLRNAWAYTLGKNLF